MRYPGYPDNRLIIDGVDITQEYGLVLLDGYTLSPPAPKIYTVDITGGDGVIDLSEALTGDIAFENRSQSFELVAINVDKREELKTKFLNRFHGRSFDYKITMDPGYTYHGRFTVSEHTHASYTEGIVVVFKIDVDAEPYKLKKHVNEVLECIGGKWFQFESGRKKVHPIITCKYPVHVAWNGYSFDVSPGTHRLYGVTFSEGINDIYFDSWRIKASTWSDIRNHWYRDWEWDTFDFDTGDTEEYTQRGLKYKRAKELKYRWVDLMNYTKDTSTNITQWQYLEPYKWDGYADKNWYDLSYVYNSDIPIDTQVTIEYDWKDL